MIMSHVRRLFLKYRLPFMAALACITAEAEVINANPSDYQNFLSQLHPGDTLVLAPGFYSPLYSHGSYPFVAGVIEDNLVQDTTGYDMEIKFQLPRPPVSGMPTGPVALLSGTMFLSRATSPALTAIVPTFWWAASPTPDPDRMTYINSTETFSITIRAKHSCRHPDP